MKKSMRMVVAAVGTVAMAAGAMGAAVGGCSSSSGTNGGGGTADTGTGSTGSGSGTSGGSGSTTCSAINDIFQVVFAPMYSAVIPGDTAVSFYIPAIVAGVSSSDKVSWVASSEDVSFTADPTTGGVLIQMLPSGSGGAVTITASTANGSCGTSTLTITSSTAAAWEAGAARYNDGVPIPMNPGEVFKPEAGAGSLRIACVNCHAPKGEDAGMGFGFNDVAHTPEQTGGFSDEVLLGIVQGGNVPGWTGDPDAATVSGLSAGQTSADAGYFDPTIVSYAEWHRFHQWNLTSEEKVGIITYLRSLAPAAQTGTANFGGFGGGHPPPDGGYMFPDGGFHHHGDGGFGGGPPKTDGGP